MERNNNPRYTVGIDLGTTNSSVSFIDLHDKNSFPQKLLIPQHVDFQVLEEKEILPSFYYELLPRERVALLPWETVPGTYILGTLARTHGLEIASRSIHSVKSWLTHSLVDRKAKILPWHGDPQIKKMSPVEVSSLFLSHIKNTWNFRFPKFPLDQQEIILTVPASYDEIARKLTIEAAYIAGLTHIKLLEEPQAAFYAWMLDNKKHLNKFFNNQDIVLVIDIGGGTTDFTLIQVKTEPKLQFERIAVGKHLLLGGDNLDLALTGLVEKKSKISFPPLVWTRVLKTCQKAKETLLKDDPPPSLTIPILYENSKIIGSNQEVTLHREELENFFLESFLPVVPLRKKPVEKTYGFREFGLPFASDPAISRHLSDFLSDNPQLIPSIVLFNGGFFKARIFKSRFLNLLEKWYKTSIKEINNQNPDLAVSKGASSFGRLLSLKAEVIHGGLTKSYYLGVLKQEENLLYAVCIIPAKTQTETSFEIQEPSFELQINVPVEFPFFESSVRLNDKPGDVIPVNSKEFNPLAPIRTALMSGKKKTVSKVRVFLESRLNEIGTIDVWSKEWKGPRTWKLEFSVQALQTASLKMSPQKQTTIEEPLVKNAFDYLEEVFFSHDKLLLENLVSEMENRIFLKKDQWPVSFLRTLWKKIFPFEFIRKHSELHEIRWLNLIGFSLRPGYGYTVDDWRVRKTWNLLSYKTPVHHRNEMCRSEWWILWRRVSGGLESIQQEKLALPLIQVFRKQNIKNKLFPRINRHEQAEIWKLVASFEWLDSSLKLEIGRLIINNYFPELELQWKKISFYVLGRLGARIPSYGPVNTVIPKEIAEEWIKWLLRIPDKSADHFFALMQISRMCKDRFRDISEPLRQTVIDFLRHENAKPHLIRLIEYPELMNEIEKDIIRGEVLPPGLEILNYEF